MGAEGYSHKVMMRCSRVGWLHGFAMLVGSHRESLCEDIEECPGWAFDFCWHSRMTPTCLRTTPSGRLPPNPFMPGRHIPGRPHPIVDTAYFPCIPTYHPITDQSHAFIIKERLPAKVLAAILGLTPTVRPKEDEGNQSDGSDPLIPARAR